MWVYRLRVQNNGAEAYPDGGISLVVIRFRDSTILENLKSVECSSVSRPALSSPHEQGWLRIANRKGLMYMCYGAVHDSGVLDM